MKVLPRTPVPPLAVDTVNHGQWDLADQRPEHFQILFFYRGHH